MNSPANISVHSTIPADSPKIITKVYIACEETNKATCANGIWDTGASFCTISSAMANQLGLVPLETKSLTSIGGKSVHRTFNALLLPDGGDFIGTSFVECDTLGNDVVIIGLNIIRLGTFMIRPAERGLEVVFKIPPI